jgi:hypothetical protein
MKDASNGYVPLCSPEHFQQFFADYAGGISYQNRVISRFPLQDIVIRGKWRMT